jgi:beta-alanine--pyruvate transaminase
MPMGAVIASSEIYNTFIKNGISEYNIEFPHGAAYTANPIACAAALATLKILENENIFLAVQENSEIFEKKLSQVKSLPFVAAVKNYGLSGEITINTNENKSLLRLAHIIEKMWQKGFYLHFIGNTIQFALPFKVTYLEMDNLFNALSDTLYELNLESSSAQHEANIVL